jgi:hypothetical protein
MTRLMVAAACSLGLVLGCGSDAKTGGSGGAPATGGATGTGGATATGGMGAVDAGAAGSGGGSAGTGGSGGATGGSAGSTMDAGAADAASGGMSAMMMIGAAAGGTLTVGGASLLVPAGALAADKQLTVTVSAPTDEPSKDSIAGDVYEFGPSGTTFTVPVALTLPLAGGVPAGKRVVVAWLDPSAAQWFPVATTVAGDKVTGLVTHFTRFALLLLDQAATCPFAGACGGSLDGTWKYSGSCIKATESEAFKCGTTGSVIVRNEYMVGGTITIGQGRYTAENAITATGTMFYTPACIAAVREGGVVDADCPKIQEAWRKQTPNALWVCSGSVAQGCSCLLTQSVMNKTMGAVVVTGQQVAFNEDGKPPGKAGDFCVRGNTVTVRDGDGAVTTAVKQ